MLALKRYEGKAIHQNLSFSTTPLEVRLSNKTLFVTNIELILALGRIDL